MNKRSVMRALSVKKSFRCTELFFDQLFYTVSSQIQCYFRESDQGLSLRHETFRYGRLHSRADCRRRSMVICGFRARKTAEKVCWVLFNFYRLEWRGPKEF